MTKHIYIYEINWASTTRYFIKLWYFIWSKHGRSQQHKTCPWIWNGVSATLQRGKYTVSYPRGRSCLLRFDCSAHSLSLSQSQGVPPETAPGNGTSCPCHSSITARNKSYNPRRSRRVRTPDWQVIRTNLHLSHTNGQHPPPPFLNIIISRAADSWIWTSSILWWRQSRTGILNLRGDLITLSCVD